MTHIERMQLEVNELETKIFGLKQFIVQNPIFLTLTEENKSLMEAQLKYMSAYNNIVKRRIELA